MSEVFSTSRRSRRVLSNRPPRRIATEPRPIWEYEARIPPTTFREVIPVSASVTWTTTTATTPHPAQGVAFVDNLPVHHSQRRRLNAPVNEIVYLGRASSTTSTPARATPDVFFMQCPAPATVPDQVVCLEVSFATAPTSHTSVTVTTTMAPPPLPPQGVRGGHWEYHLNT